MKSLVTRTLFCFVILIIAIPCLPLFAQETTPEDQPKLTEEMVVTARKREETIQEVPISVAAPTGEELRDRGAETIEDIAANVAGFTVQNLGPGQSQVAMRGVSAGQIARDQPGVKEQVGVYLDESVISLSLFTPDVDLFDLNRVEVLRGPQGTLFGSGSLSGTLRYITNQPKINLSETIGEFTASSITDGGTGGSAKVAVNVPFGTTSAMRVAAYYTRYGGFIDAVQPGLSINEDVNTGDRIGARLAFRFEPNDRLTITPRLLYQEINLDGWNRVDIYNILANPFTTTRPKVTLGEREIFTQIDEPFTDEFLLGDLNVEYKIGDKTLTSITSYSDRDVLVVRDATALTGAFNGGAFGHPESAYTLDAPLDDATAAKALTQELRLAGSTGRFDWLAGAFYSSIDRDYGQRLFVDGFETITSVPTAGQLGATRDVLFFSDLSYKFDQISLFGEATWSVTDRFDLTGGLRYYDFEEDRTQTFDGYFSPKNTSAGSVKADGVAPRVIASYKLSDNTRLNAQISKGFRLGGINDPINLPICTPADRITFGGRGGWEDETLWNYEVGAKSSIMGGRGSINAAAFYMDIENLQATVTAGTCSSRLIFNVPKARTTGIEAELALAPTDNFDFAISASKTDSELRSTLTTTDEDGNVSVLAGIEEGNRFATVPEFQMAAAATVRRPFAQGWIGYATGVYQHVGERFTQIGDQAPGLGTVDITAFGNSIGGPLTQSTFTFDAELPAYDIVNLRIGALVNKWDVALFVNNVTDETAFLALDREAGLLARIAYLTNSPRTFGISTRVNF